MRQIYLRLVVLCVVLAPSFAVADEPAELTIRVHYEKPFLDVVDRTGKVIAAFTVALPHPSFTPKLPAVGYVRRVWHNPPWIPTVGTRRASGWRLKKRYPPGHPMNAMGVGFLIIRYVSGSFHPAIGIHGTNQPKKIGQRVSRGCIRMHNRDWKHLAELIEGKRVRVVFARF